MVSAKGVMSTISLLSVIMKLNTISCTLTMSVDFYLREEFCPLS